ncbi:MAG TPA: nucleoside-diphosphate sugar epimerase/dehydratase [Bacilli bacterium]|nr:nucleoside-diphosphate sugar epimerase/dehydratase [Bacilli bacterium]
MKREKRTNKYLRLLQYLIIDTFLLLFTFFVALIAMMFWDIPIDVNKVLIGLPLVIAFKLAAYYLFGLYKMVTNHVGFEDIIKISVIAILSNLVVVLFYAITKTEFMNKFAFVFITPLEIALITLPRIIKRLINYFKSNIEWNKSLGKRTLIVGAGNGGELVLKEIYRNARLNNIPVAFVDDDQEKIGSKLLGVKIIGPIKDIKIFIDDYNIEEVIIAIANIESVQLREIVELVSEKHIKIKRLPLLTEIGANETRKIIDVKIEDLLNRDEIHLDNDQIESFIKDKIILVTGGGGSIGSELCRQIVTFKPKQLIIFDIYENNAYDIQMELERKFHKEHVGSCLKVFIGSVYNEDRLRTIFEEFKPQIVFHAAAYKHVPLMEDSAVEALRTNVLGTYNVAKLSSEFKVEKMVLVSSDKAVRPTNVMGATKRYAEMIIQYFDSVSETNYSAVRFGNVLGSNGSVVPLFKKQIEDGGPVTVTHPEITRFFMTIPESVSLILQSAVYAKGGEIFILDMGEPVKIKDLAEKMIRLAGFRPNIDIEIEYTGLRPGEKLYEELLLDISKNSIKTDNKKIFIESNGHTDQKVNNEIVEAIDHIETLTNVESKELLKKLVKTYHENKK